VPDDDASFSGGTVAVLLSPLFGLTLLWWCLSEDDVDRNANGSDIRCARRDR
jgi:hypothetical protein